MILNLLVTKTADGFTGEIPSLKGCESWASTEDELLLKIEELVKYYMKLKVSHPVRIDKVKDNFTDKVYKVIFDKQG